MDATRTSCIAGIDDQTSFLFVTGHSLWLLVAHRYLPLAWPKFSGRAAGLGHHHSRASHPCHVCSVISRVQPTRSALTHTRFGAAGLV